MPNYTFKFTPEFWWTMFLFIIGTLATIVYADTANAADWTGQEWASFGVSTALSLVRSVAGFVLGAIGMNRQPPQGDVRVE